MAQDTDPETDGGGRIARDPAAAFGGAARRHGVRSGRGAVAARAVGREVMHERFGRGVVLEAEEDGREVKYTVRFGTTIKKVLARFLEGGHDGDPA